MCVRVAGVFQVQHALVPVVVGWRAGRGVHRTLPPPALHAPNVAARREMYCYVCWTEGATYLPPPPCNLPTNVVTVRPQGGRGGHEVTFPPGGGGGGLHHKTVP